MRDIVKIPIKAIVHKSTIIKTSTGTYRKNELNRNDKSQKYMRKYFRFSIPIEVSEALKISINDRFYVYYDTEKEFIVFQRITPKLVPDFEVKQ